MSNAIADQDMKIEMSVEQAFAFMSVEEMARFSTAFEVGADHCDEPDKLLAALSEKLWNEFDSNSFHSQGNSSNESSDDDDSVDSIPGLVFDDSSEEEEVLKDPHNTPIPSCYKKLLKPPAAETKWVKVHKALLRYTLDYGYLTSTTPVLFVAELESYDDYDFAGDFNGSKWLSCAEGLREFLVRGRGAKRLAREKFFELTEAPVQRRKFSLFLRYWCDGIWLDATACKWIGEHSRF